MKNSTKLTLLVLAIAAFTMNFQCGFNRVDVIPKYNFLGKLSLSPYKKIYAVGDTIKLQCYISTKELFDEKSSSNILLDTTYLMLDFLYDQLLPTPQRVDTLTSFTTQFTNNAVFSARNPGFNTLTCSTRCADSTYRFTVSFVPQRAGIYFIEPTFSIAFCPGALNQFMTTGKFLFDLVDVNKDIWLALPSEVRRATATTTEGKIDRNELFIFEVQ